MIENRVHERIEYRTTIEVYRYYFSSGELVVMDLPIRLELFDLSISGMGVLSKQELVDVDIMEFTLYLDQIPYRVMAKVAWGQHNNIYFRYGLEIIGHNNMLFRHMRQIIQRKAKEDV